jgi:hypothetical protein
MHCLAKSTMAVQWHNYEVTEQDSLIIDLFQAKVDQGYAPLHSIPLSFPLFGVVILAY